MQVDAFFYFAVLIVSMPASLIDTLLNYQSSFSGVVRFDPARQKLVRLDFTANNDELTAVILNDTGLFCSYIDQQLLRYNASFGIGGYAEHRTIYSRSSLFDARQAGDEPRRLHLGIDIWGKAGEPVMAPMDSTVHSFAFNDIRGDYGATIILQHTLDKNVFYTLYGHLSLDSLKDLQEGAVIKKGQLFAAFGKPRDNGHWPPHLHFQVIEDLQGYKGDYPGVCKFSEKEKYLCNCPDPDLILCLMQYLAQ
jgi:murein DD-endopeptidase MepM/ murein hydrolase activator NlpD